MNPTTKEIDALRRAFAADEPSEAPGAECVDDARIWAAVHGELPIEEIHGVVEHLATCPACAQSWRFAMHLGDRPEAAEGDVPNRSFAARRSVRPWAPALRSLAAAAVLVLAVGLGFHLLRDEAPRHRGAVPESETPAIVPGPTLESLLPAAESLPRESFVLRWSEVEGAVYDLYVTTADLDEIVVARGLEGASYQVPQEVLAAVPTGVELYWRVEARQRDGDTLHSGTFIIRIE